MLKLTPSALSQIFWQQTREKNIHLRARFTDQLLPLLGSRLSNNNLLREGVGSIGYADALSLFLISYLAAPRNIAEVGTYIGNSSTAIAYGACISGNLIHLVTCDKKICAMNPIEGLNIPEGNYIESMQCSSTKMFEKLASVNICLDMLFVDGILLDEDMPLLSKLLKPQTVIVLDDCVNDEKGHLNLNLFKRSGIVKPPISLNPLPLNATKSFQLSELNDTHFYLEPFEKGTFTQWEIEDSPRTGLLIPKSSVKFSNQ